MGDSRVFMFPDNFGGTSGGNTTLDPNLLLALNNNGGFSGNGNWMWILFLFFLYPLMRNGGWNNGGGLGGGFGSDGTGYLANLAANDTGRDLLMQAINGNRSAIDQLSSMLGCKLGDIQTALCNVTSQIQNVGAQLGMSTQQVINAVQAGNTQLVMQIAQCCCDVRESISNVNHSLTKGFADLGYASEKQTCAIEKSIASSTAQILEGQRAAEMREMQDKIDALREKSAQQATVINNAQQTQVVGQMIAQATTPIAQAVGVLQNDINGIKCKLPETVTLPYSCATAVPTQFLYGGLGLGLTGFGCGNSLWG